MEYGARHVEGYPGVPALNGSILANDDGLAFERKGQRKFAIPFTDMIAVYTASSVDL
jgi:hypothetical protein